MLQHQGNIFSIVGRYVSGKHAQLTHKTTETVLSAREAVRSRYQRAGQWCVEQIHYYAPKTLGVAKQTIDRFHQTVTEGHYQEKPSSFWVDVLQPKEAKGTPKTDTVFAGDYVFSKAMMFANRLIIGGMFALLAMNTMVLVGVSLTVLGLGFYGYEYFRSKRSREDIINEVNFAGQEVEGRRADLCRLYQAQMRLMNIASAFKLASHQTTCDTAHEIIADVEEIRKRVKVLKPGKYGARADLYDFSEPHLKLVDDDHLKQATVTSRPLQSLELKRAWDEKGQQQYDAVIDKIMELEDALPPDVAERLQQRRAEKNTPQAFAQPTAPVHHL